MTCIKAFFPQGVFENIFKILEFSPLHVLLSCADSFKIEGLILQNQSHFINEHSLSIQCPPGSTASKGSA